jgi:predicted RNA-binding Zn-ribbon protein involved in translation (DUF1610 family)
MSLRKAFMDKGGQVAMPRDHGAFDLCPSCYKLSLKREGSCRKCSNCGYSTC